LDTSKPQLIRALGLRDGIAIHMGVIIGSGIFIVPATIAGHVPATGPMILVWVVAGLLSLFGALSVAELSAVLPQTGGPNVYLRHSFGRIWGFLFSWNDFRQLRLPWDLRLFLPISSPVSKDNPSSIPNPVFSDWKSASA
jgi:APA family basic amino acid/polyamine antiporter